MAKNEDVAYFLYEDYNGFQKTISLSLELVPDSLFSKLVSRQKDMRVVTQDIEVDGKKQIAFVINKRFCLMDKIVEFVENPESVTFPDTHIWLQKLVEEADYLGLPTLLQKVAHRLQVTPTTNPWPPTDGMFVVYASADRRNEW
jgi:hypothetical protein